MQSPEVREQMIEHIKGWQTSGLSQKKFCEQANIPYHVFHYWYKVFRKTDSADSGSFVKLPVTGLNTFCSVELFCPDGKRLVFHEPVSPDYLKALIS